MCFIVGAILTAVCGTFALANATTPDIQFVGYNESTFEYTYKVTVHPTDQWDFSWLQANTYVVNGDIIQFSYVGPVYQTSGPAGGIGYDDSWSHQVQKWYGEDPTNPGEYKWYDAAVWYAGPGDTTIKPAQLTSDWTGTFVLTATNTTYREGWMMTMEGRVGSDTWFNIAVPGPAPIPEPASLLSLGSLFAGFGIFLKRRA